MFNETSFLGDLVNPEGVPLWQQLHFPDKSTWKQAGRPGLPTELVNTGASAAAPGTPAGAAPSGGGFLSGIPTTYLLIGGAILLLMVMKK